MRTSTLLGAAAITLAFVQSAYSQTEVLLTGSSAFRGATHNAILGVLTDPAPGVNTVVPTYAYGSETSLGGAKYAVFKGRLGGTTSGIDLVIKTSWSGSVAGIQTVSAALATLPVKFLPTSTTTTSGGNNVTTLPALVSQVPDIAMADNTQSSTLFNGTVSTLISGVPTNVSYPALIEEEVAIVTFKWVAGYGAPAGLTNMTTQLAKQLLTAGELPMSFFTGSAGDVGKTVYATGRDPDSGTRTIAFAESGFGIFEQAFQYQPPTSTTNPITSHIAWPAITVNGINYVEGNGGYSSGGDVGKVLRNQLNFDGNLATNDAIYISYVGVSDAATATAAHNPPTTTGAGPGKELTFNGVPFSVDNIKNGQYTFWSKEYLSHKAFPVTAPGPDKKALSDALVLKLKATATAGNGASIKLTDMAVSRGFDGGPVTP